MKPFLLYFLAVGPAGLAAQTRADSNDLLTYQFVHPTKSALTIAMDGLPSLDGEFVSIKLQRGDSVAEIAARVRNGTWARNPPIWGQTPDGVPEVYFGLLRTYLRGDQRFRILVIPASCAGCDGNRRAVFLPYAATGYVVGGKRLGH